MATLAATTREARLILKYAAIIIVGLLLLIWTFRIIMFIGNAIFSPSASTPDYRYGHLPALGFTTKFNKPQSYTVNTVSGRLPVFPPTLKVFKLKSSETNLSTLATIRDNAQNAGFSTDEKEVDELLYQWKHNFDSERILTYNILSNDFDISSNYLNQANSISTGQLPEDQDSIKIVFDLLGQLNQDISDIDTEKTSVTYYKIENGTLVEADSYSNAQITRIVLYQKNINDLPIVYKSFNSSDMKFYLARSGFSTSIVDAFYKHRLVDETESGVYSIKTPTEALEDLKKGNALILENNAPPSVTITNIYLAYYLGDETSSYLVPVIVFDGIKFKAYVEAIKKVEEKK